MIWLTHSILYGKIVFLNGGSLYKRVLTFFTLKHSLLLTIIGFLPCMFSLLIKRFQCVFGLSRISIWHLLGYRRRTSPSCGPLLSVHRGSDDGRRIRGLVLSTYYHYPHRLSGFRQVHTVTYDSSSYLFISINTMRYDIRYLEKNPQRSPVSSQAMGFSRNGFHFSTNILV